jgi:GNAT superfamily N-acetyltransferase
MVELKFRAATNQDASQIQHLVQASFRAVDSRPNWTGNTELAAHFKLSIDEVLTTLAREDTVTLNAVTKDGEEDAEILVATIDVSKRGGSDVGRLSMIAVDERFQQGGIGQKVLAYAENYCRDVWDVRRFTLNALSTRPALVEWYLRRGYRKTGETTPFPTERFPEIELPEDLCFIEMEKDLS